MYAVVQSGGKQYRVEQGSTLRVEKLDAVVGAEIVFDRVLMVGDQDRAMIGRPTVAGAQVTATVVRQMKAPKIIVFKKRSKKGYKKTQGHRQSLTEVKISAISIP